MAETERGAWLRPEHEFILCNVQWPVRGDSLVWEVVAVKLMSGERTVLEIWHDPATALRRAKEIERERITAVMPWDSTVQ